MPTGAGTGHSTAGQSVRITPETGALLQRPLPTRSGTWGNEALFAHPAEQEVARILDFFGLRWAYEPTSFTLRTHEDGRVAEMMTPDFYLPDLGLYLEVTTMRQSLVTRKNRKARLLRDRYPDVNLKLLYRADYQRLVGYYRGAIDQPQNDLSLSVFLSREQIDAAVSNITTRLMARCERSLASRGRLPMLVISSRGSRSLLRDCLDQMHACGVQPPACELSFTVSGARRRITPIRSRGLPTPGEQVILLETMVSTGMHLAHVQRWLRRRRVDVLDSAALCARPGSRMMGCRLDHIAYEAPNLVLAGYGLQLRSELANRRDMVTVRAPVPDPVVDMLTRS